MRTVKKALCIVLSLVLLAETAAIQTQAADAAESANSKDTAVTTESSAQDTEGSTETTVEEQTTVINDTDTEDASQDTTDSDTTKSEGTDDVQEDVQGAQITNLKAEVTENGIRLTWESADEVTKVDIRVYQYDETKKDDTKKDEECKGDEVEDAALKEQENTGKALLEAETLEEGATYVVEVAPCTKKHSDSETAETAEEAETAAAVKVINPYESGETLLAMDNEGSNTAQEIPVTAENRTKKSDGNDVSESTLKDGQVKLSWTLSTTTVTVSKYEVLQDGTLLSDNSVQIDTTYNTATISGLADTKEYKFTVNGYSSENTTTTPDVTGTVSFYPAAYQKPDEVSSFTSSSVCTSNGDTLTLSWEAPSGGNVTYCLYDCKNNKDVLSDSTKTSYSVTLATGTYTYMIKTYQKKADGTYLLSTGFTQTFNHTCTRKSSSQVQMMQYSGKLNSKAPYFKSATAKKKSGTLKKGTKIVKTLDFANKRYLCLLKNGKKVWISKDRMRFTKQTYTKSYNYSRHTAEAYVNAKGFSSKTKYLIWNSYYTQHVYIFTGSKGNWTCVRDCEVATGKAPRLSTVGYGKIGKKLKNGWKKPSYQVTRAVQYSGGNYYHTRLKKRKNKNKVISPSMGYPKSHGCIRMYDSDIDYIYYNVPKKTKVVGL